MDILDGQPVAADGSVDADRLGGMDVARHNEESRQMWRSFHAGRPTRVPIFLGTNSRFFLFNELCNSRRITFREYTQDPNVMFDMLLRFGRWTRFNLLQDAELGLPEKWVMSPDFQNYYEAAWFGCPLHFLEGQVPDTTPAFADQPQRLMEDGLPDPFAGVMARGREYYEHFRRRAQRESFLGRPIEIAPPHFGLGTDGVMTVACNLFGPDFVCTAMIDQPEELYQLLSFITEATIDRMLAWRRYTNQEIPPKEFGFADDSIALISTEMYREHILPHHRRLCEVMAPCGLAGMHLCGDATRHFVTIRDALGARCFDTGFPIDFAAIRQALGPKVILQGGPHIELLRTATPAAVVQEVSRIFQSGVAASGAFALREGNNLAPHTPLENTEAMYHAGRELGRYGPDASFLPTAPRHGASVF